MAGFQGSLGHTGEHAMYGMITSLLTVLWISAYTLLANPAAGQQPAKAAPAPVGCTGDYVCGDDPSVVATWPLERWETVRKADLKVATPRPADRRPATVKQ
jgi:hypothetical protein